MSENQDVVMELRRDNDHKNSWFSINVMILVSLMILTVGFNGSYEIILLLSLVITFLSLYKVTEIGVNTLDDIFKVFKMMFLLLFFLFLLVLLMNKRTEIFTEVNNCETNPFMNYQLRGSLFAVTNFPVNSIFVGCGINKTITYNLTYDLIYFCGKDYDVVSYYFRGIDGIGYFDSAPIKALLDDSCILQFNGSRNGNRQAVITLVKEMPSSFSFDCLVKNNIYIHTWISKMSLLYCKLRRDVHKFDREFIEWFFINTNGNIYDRLTQLSHYVYNVETSYGLTHIFQHFNLLSSYEDKGHNEL
jgi:energy-coupling factor transporter transmembrane protein EcfT